MSGRHKKHKKKQNYNKGKNRRHKNKMLITGGPEPKVFEPYTYRYLDQDKLRERCFATIEDYKVEGEVTRTPAGVYYYRDNGSNILAVAHLDTVQALRKFVPVEGGRKIYNPQLDDRLGAYTILDLLPSLGLKFDILLTEGEETGNSTAKHFSPPEGKEYLWMMEVDRMGTDTVCYKYENDKLVKRLQSVGCRVGIGSFTDISVLGHLGVQGMNFGCGYYNNHSTEAYFLVQEFEEQVDRIVAFYEKYKNTKLVYDPATCGRRTYTSYYHNNYTGNESYRRHYDDYHWMCEDCSTYPCKCNKAIIVTNQYCKHCGALKLGKYCEDYCEMFASQCVICDDPNCMGLSPCEICGWLHHQDLYVKHFKYCKDCLKFFINIDEKLMEDMDTLKDKTEVINSIKELLCQ